MAVKRHALLELRDAAYEAAAPAHERMKNEISLYRNEDYTGESWIKRFKRSVTRSISPQINTAINRLIPVFTEQMAHINVEPIRSDASELERMATDELQEHLDNLEAVDSETEELRTLILHNQAMGNAISKTVYDPDTEMVRAVAINPLRFAPSPYVTRSDFRSGGYVVHTTYHNYMTVSKKYPGVPIPNKRYNEKELMGGNIRVDEVYMTGEIARAIGIPQSKDSTVVIATIVDDEPYRASHDDLWYPDFPFAHWRNFLDVSSNGKPSDFWGYGYATLLEPQQKVLDEFLANYMWITRNLATGRLLAREGVLDQEQLSNSSGDIINVRNLQTGEPIANAVQFVQNPEAPVSLLNMIQMVNQFINEQVPSLSPVFAGQSPGASTSGRAISNLQTAVFTQLSDNIRDMNAFRERRARIRLNFIQQFAKRSMKPNRWRMGYDLPELSEEARYQPFMVSTPDTSSLPQTPLGKLQVISMLMGMGIRIKPERLMEMVGLKSGYGLSEADLVQAITPPPGLSLGNPQSPIDEASIAGLEAVPRVER